jgi:lipoprotein-anchoring transpeptidase ErfK/SrfK
MSHGCINFTTADAAWVFDWIGVGDLVNIHY